MHEHVASIATLLYELTTSAYSVTSVNAAIANYEYAELTESANYEYAGLTESALATDGCSTPAGP